MRNKRFASRRLTGFTLIEIVIALTLVSFIMLGLVTAMRTMADTTVRVNQVSERTGDMQLIAGFLKRTFASIEPFAIPSDNPDEGQRPYFEGKSQRTQWAGLLPARHGGGGMQLFELSVAEAPGRGKVLMLYYVPFTSAPNWEKRSKHILLDGVEQLSITYQGSDQKEEWLDEWPQDLQVQGILPARIKLKIQTMGRHWPELIYALDPL